MWAQTKLPTRSIARSRRRRPRKMEAKSSSLGKSMSPSQLLFLLLLLAAAERGVRSDPTPAPWPEQFHAKLFMNLTKTGQLQLLDLWYDWPRGRNLNLIQAQLGELLYDVEWDNGTSYYYTLAPPRGSGSCRTRLFPVGVLRPDFMADNSTYLGRAYTAGFLCDVWTKVDFIWYYEDVDTRRPVRWDFFTGMSSYVITFEEGAVLEDSEWQAPSYCFTDGGNDGADSIEEGNAAGTDLIGFRRLAQPQALPSNLTPKY